MAVSSIILILDCEPYISGNVGSGSVEEMTKWVEYMISEGDSLTSNLRRENIKHKKCKINH